MAQDLETERMQEQYTKDQYTKESDRGDGRQKLAPERPRSVLREHPVRVVIGVLVFIALIAGGIIWWQYASTYETTDDAQVDGHIYPVSSRVAGKVIAVKVDNNQQVQQGQVLVQLDPTDYQVAVQRAQADLSQAEANTLAALTQVPITSTATSSQVSSAGAGVEEAAAGISVAQQQYQAALARVREAEANYIKAQKDVERYRPLAEKQEISRQQFDQAVATADALKATVETAKANADATSRQVTQARARLSEARAQQASTASGPQLIAAQRARAASSQAAAAMSKATLDQTRLNLNYTTILAPVAGVVGKRSVEAGQQVQMGQELLSIVPLNEVWVTANFKETQLKNMRPGQPVTIHADATGRDYKGHVDSFPAATGARYSLLPPENATGNFVKVVQRLPVKIMLEQDEDREHLLRPGMSVEPKVRVK
jgi:membrane fusion protein (multidrug efflux system)